MSAQFCAAEIVPAGLGDAPDLAGVITRAFLELPPSLWLVPDDLERRRQIFREYFQMLLEQTLRNGWVDTTVDLRSAALWLPVAAEPRMADPNYDARLAAITGPYVDRFRDFDQALDAHHPSGPHLHLAILAVEPGRQGHGIGSALLSARHSQLDAHDDAAYLEASSPRSCALYMRHGYALLPDAPFRLPDDGPAMYPMLRPPHAGRVG